VDAITGLKLGVTLDPGHNWLACQKIDERYQKEGCYFASCTLDEGYQDGQSRVVFDITEGPVVRIGQVNFTGFESLTTSARLRRQVARCQAFLRAVRCGLKFVASEIESDVAKLAAYYPDYGFLDARAVRTLAFNDDRAQVDITCHMIEGPRYRVKEVVVTGCLVPRSEQVVGILRGILRLRQGDLYDKNMVETDKLTLTDYFGYRGYAVTVEEKLVVADRETDPGLVRVEYHVHDKPLANSEIHLPGIQ
jgi:outer membrane protein assembly factor BamA